MVRVLALIVLVTTQLSLYALEAFIEPVPEEAIFKYKNRITIDGYDANRHVVEALRSEAGQPPKAITLRWLENAFWDDQITHGTEYHYSLTVLSKTGIQLGRLSIEVTLPKDLEISESVSLNEDTRENLGRLVLHRQAKLITHGHSLLIRVTELISNHGSIVTSAEEPPLGLSQKLVQIFVKKAEGVLTLDLRGGEGLPGKAGQMGKQGSAGAAGANGSAARKINRDTFSACTHGTDGKRGGAGGSGTVGENGRQGGSVINPTLRVAEARHFFLLKSLAEGKGGAAGPGGPGGKGGPGGQGGISGCNGSRRNSGPVGATGPKGPDGKVGEPGAVVGPCIVLGDEVVEGQCE